MKEHILKFGLLFSLGLIAVSCHKDIKDDISSLENRVSILEKWQSSVNANLESLQRLTRALEARDYLVKIAPLHKDGQIVGQSLYFSQLGLIHFYNDGAPSLGIDKDTDNNYYWTFNGTWLLDKVPAQGPQGITPEVKIQGGRWLVTVNNGTTWSDLGPATQEDKTTSLIQSIEKSDDGKYATVVLSDGREMEFEMVPAPFADKTLTAADIPDANFRNYLISVYDTDQDGAIQLSEINKEKKLSYFSEKMIFKSLKGIEYFEALERFEIYYYLKLTELDLSQNKHITYVSLYNIPLASLKLGSGVEELELTGSKITTLDLSACTQLKRLYLNENLTLESITFPDRYQMEYFDLWNAPKLTALNFKRGVRFDRMTIGNLPNLTSINVSGLGNLNSFQLYDAPLVTEVDLSKNPLISHVFLSDVPALGTVWLPAAVSDDELASFRSDNSGTQFIKR